MAKNALLEAIAGFFFRTTLKPLFSKLLKRLAPLILFILIIFVMPYWMYLEERKGYRQSEAFTEIKDNQLAVNLYHTPNYKDIAETLVENSNYKWIHFNTPEETLKITKPIYDSDFDLVFDKALEVERQVLYCQWEETVVYGDDEDDDDEYYYHKKWVPYRINSYYFNNPLTYHNPSKDSPIPQKLYTLQNDNSKVFIKNEKENFILSHKLLQKLKMPKTTVDFGDVADFHKNYELTKEMIEINNENNNQNEQQSSTYQQHGFKYIGKGVFYCPYENTVFEKSMKAVGLFTTGNIIGSALTHGIANLINDCNPGDIKIEFIQMKPTKPDISIIAHPSKVGNEIILDTALTSNDYEIGYVHDGFYETFEDVFKKETTETFRQLLFIRLLSIIWGFILAAYLSYFSVPHTNEKRLTVVGLLALDLILIIWTLVCRSVFWLGILFVFISVTIYLLKIDEKLNWKRFYDNFVVDNKGHKGELFVK
ncbi:hypothetical protein ABK040_002561 [Willaertia magna]